MARKKSRQDKVEEMKKEKARGRWVVVVVFGVMGLVSLGFWVMGQSKGEILKDPFKPEPVVWDREEIKNTDEILNINTGEIERQIRNLVEGLQGKYVVYGKNIKNQISKIKNKESMAYLDWEIKIGPEGEDLMNQPMQAASLIKVPVMVAVYRMADRGELDLDEKYTLQEADKVGGSGSLVGKPVGYEVSWRKLVWHMGNESDNTAFQAVVNYFGEDRLEEGFRRMGLLSVSIKENKITVNEVVKLFEGLYGYRWLEEDESEEILSAMEDTWYEDRIPAGISQSQESPEPFGTGQARGKSQEIKVKSPQNHSVQGRQEVRVAHKVGTGIGVISDAGIVYADEPYLLVIMTEGVNEVEAREVLPEISKVVYNWVVDLY